MGWPCKLCSTVVPGKSDIRKHYRLHHRTFGSSHAMSCIHIDCPCSFRNWSTLRCYLSRQHPETISTHLPQASLLFMCLLCHVLCQTPGFPNEKEFFKHIGHLRNHETVKCVFEGCDHETNIYGTFATHKHRKHTPHTSQDFKPDIICQRQLLEAEEPLDYEATAGGYDCQDDG